MFRLTLNSGYTASQERITVVSRGLPVDSYAYKPCYCPRRIYIELGPWHFEIFAIFSRQIQVKIKKVLSECGAPGTVPCVKSVPGYCITFIKRLDENLS